MHNSCSASGSDIKPAFSLTHLLQHCIQTKNLKSTKTIHTHLLKTGLFFTSLNLLTNLILSYATCLPTNFHPSSLTIFFNSIIPSNSLPFNTLLSHFSRNGFPFLALHTLSFLHSNGLPLDSYSLCSSLKASSSIKSLSFTKMIHTHFVKLGFSSSVYVSSALIDSYVKSSAIDYASKLFDEIPLKNSVCANALLSGFEEAGMWVESLNLIQVMGKSKMDYDKFTLSAVLRVCASLSAIQLGKQAHAYSLRTIFDFEFDLYLQSSLIEMYGKCGFVEKAHHVFSLRGVEMVEKRKRDVVLWTSMVGVYGRNGRFEDVIGLFRDMLMEGVRPDGLAFLAVISACGYTGNVKLGIEYFESMIRDFGSQPDSEHYSCVVDMLCRGGELEKAFELVKRMPFEGTVSMWGALLTAAANCGNVEIGKLAAERALELNPQNVAIYVLLSNLYAAVGMWDEIEELRKVMKERQLTKDIGRSWIEIAS